MTAPDHHIHTPDGSCCAPQVRKFAHLHQHTQYSLLDGAAKLKDLLKWVKEVTPNDPACAITDHGNMHGSVHFYNYAIGMGVKPILGYEAYVAAGSRFDRKSGESGEKGTFHLTLLARDFEGYQNLCRLSSAGYLQGYYYKPRIDRELLQQHSKGVIALSGCLGAEVPQFILQDRLEQARERLLWYQSVFRDNYFIEVQDHGLPEDKKVMEVLRQWAREFGIGMAATNDGHYVKKEDALAHETLLAIQTKATMADEKRFKFPCDEFYVKSLEEMQASMPVDVWGEEPFDNTAHIASLCNVDLPVGKKRVYQMPALPIPEGRTMAEELRVQTYRGAVKRYAAHLTEDFVRRYAARSWAKARDGAALRTYFDAIYAPKIDGGTCTAEKFAALDFNAPGRELARRLPDFDPATADMETLYTALAFMGSIWESYGKSCEEKYTKYPALEELEAAPDDLLPGMDEATYAHALVLMRRAEYELSVINNMGFPDYFLIVADYINWAKDQGISVGPGRGSGAGSLVAYAIRITNLDPLEYELLFERFLNPDRISMPDFDIDFSDARREEVIQYVRRKYGDDKVAQIATFGTMASKACLKDVARVMSLPYGDVDKVSKLIPIKFGKSYSLEEARESVPDIQEMLKQSSQLEEAYNFAQKLEGLTRHASVHAAGVVIGKTQLTDLVPLMRNGDDGGVVCQFDMKAVEDIGLIKMDFLGLRTLSFLEEAHRILKESKGLTVDFDDIPLDDERTFELLSRGDTKGVFQLEGAGIADASRRLKPRRLADIIALSALYRPGPMENIPTYVRRHHGVEDVDYVKDGFPNSEQWLTKILKETYGIPVYQEQIMQIASEVAGYSLGGADLLRRCIAEGTLVLDAGSGRRIPIEQVEAGMHVLSLGPDYRFYRVEVSERMDNGVQNVYNVRTRSGRQIQVTRDHPLLTLDGWRHLSDLRPGDTIAVPSRQGIHGRLEPDEARRRVLAFLLGDGNTYTRAGGGHARARFYNSDPEMIAAFSEAARTLGARVAMDQHSTTGVQTVRCHAAPDGTNPVVDLVRVVGLDKLSFEKRVPLEVFEYTEEALARFLGDLWSTDGSVEATRVSYASSSPLLIDDVAHLLSRFGIVAMRRQAETLRRPRYELLITDQDDVTRFADRIGVFLVSRKRARLDILVLGLADRTRNQSVHLIPASVGHLVREAKDRSGRSWTDAGAVVGTPGNRLSSGLNLSRPRRALSRHRTLLLGEAFGCSTLQNLASSDVLWDPIVEVVEVGEKRVFDLAVPPFANFIASDIVVHNSMGKKDAEEMKRQRTLFVQGSIQNGVPQDEASRLFDLLEAFANYGFNKSHSAAYGVITYQTAWLKANHPVEFMAALLTVERRDSDKVAEYVSDARKMGVRVLPPDINRSGADFAVAGEEILFGLYAIKGLGENAVLRILDERTRGGRFVSLADFCRRIDSKTCNRKGLEALVKSGAFDAFGERQQLLASLEEAVAWAQGAASLMNSGMDALFGAAEVAPEPKLRVGVTPLTELEKLSLEKDSLGLYISGHPLEQYEGLREAASCRIAELETWFFAQNPKGRVRAVLAGMVESVVKKPTKSGGMMARFNLADESATIELVAFSRSYERIQEKLLNDTPALVIVELESEDGGLRAIAEELVPAAALADIPKVMYVNIDLDVATKEDLSDFQSYVDEHAGALPTYFKFVSGEQFVVYQLDRAVGSSETIRVVNDTFHWAQAYLAYDNATILARFAPQKPAWQQRQQQARSMQA